MNSTLKGFLMSFIKSIDLYNYLLKNHHRRTAIAAYHIGKSMMLSEDELSDLVIAASLHDIGAITVSERDALIHMDVINPHPHSRLGCYMLESFPPFHKIAQILYYHHWPYEEDRFYHLDFGRVPIQSYIIHVADRIEILIHHNCSILTQKQEIAEKIKSYQGSLFHPEVVDSFLEISHLDSFWLDIENLSMEYILEQSISSSFETELSLDVLEEFAYTISKIIDTRSKFTISHSFGVSAVAYEIAHFMGYEEEKCRKIKIAGLLHDIGKIAISPGIIEKTGSLDSGERAEIQTHAYFTNLILKDIEGLDEISSWAANHHENHDGSGYPKNISERKITEEMDIIAYADIYTALSEERPYRASQDPKQILEIMKKQFSMKHGRKVLEMIELNIDPIEKACKKAILEGEKRYNAFQTFAKENGIEQE